MRRTFALYWTVVGLFVLVLGWWIVFFGMQGPRLVARLHSDGVGLSEDQIEVLLEATRQSQRMLLYEGAFITFLMLIGVYLVMRSMRAEVRFHQRQRDFLSAVTHELRSPIASARLYVESLLLGRAEGEKRERYLRNSLEDLDRLGDTVERLLDTARASAGRTRVEVEPVDLAEATRAALARLANSPEGKAQVELDAPRPVSVDADPSALESILRNLLGNSIKYASGPNGEPPKVFVRVTQDAGAAHLYVRDNGPGFSAGAPRKLFLPFMRGGDESTRKAQGVGLGLFLVAELVRAHGGRVSASNASGGGFEVAIRLPLRTREVAA